MSRTRYDTAEEIEARIDLFIAKRDKSLRHAGWLECGAKWLHERAEKTETAAAALGLIASSAEAEREAAKLRSAAEHEDRVTLPKLKQKLSEMQTAPIPGVGDVSVPRK